MAVRFGPMARSLPRPAGAFVAAVLVFVGCNADRAKEPSASAPPPTPPAKTAARDDSFRYPERERLVAFGDVHGDVQAVRAVLRLAGVLGDKDDWIGGKTAVVQTGDQLDRGDEEPEVLDLFDALKEKAEKAGGAFYALNGNHEVMNVAGDFRYVTSDGFADFRGTAASGPSRGRASLVPEDQRGRAAALLPGGPVALRLSKRPIVIAVGDTLFVHGGVLPSHVRYGLGKLNSEAARWMRGELDRVPAMLESPSSPVWAREYSSGDPSESVCGTLAGVLTELGVARMVVGHTVQSQGINSACGERVWRVDVGLAKHYGGRPAALEIAGGKTRVLD